MSSVWRGLSSEFKPSLGLILDHWQDANATWHRHPDDVFDPLF
jgi:hypothetical protein